jgi:hypothetical protein
LNGVAQQVPQHVFQAEIVPEDNGRDVGRDFGGELNVLTGNLVPVRITGTSDIIREDSKNNDISR